MGKAPRKPRSAIEKTLTRFGRQKEAPQNITDFTGVPLGVHRRSVLEMAWQANEHKVPIDPDDD